MDSPNNSIYNINDITKKWLEYSRLTLSKYLSKYGTSIFTTLMWAIALFIISGSIYQFNINQFYPNVNIIGCLDGFYISAITFFTIGFGDIVPITMPMRILVCAEGALGVFFMAYLVALIFHKTIR